ncbi:MAG: Na+/H+ antiporter subunit E [Pseudomonadota bacterium]
MRIVTAVILFALWLSFSVSLSPAHMVVGAIVSVLVAWLNPALPSMRRLSWSAIFAYQPWLFGRIFKSGLHVTRLILDPKLPIAPRLIRREIGLKSDGELAVFGNSITLTPGTITVEIAPGEVLVHAIDAESAQDLLDGTLENKVQRVFSGSEQKQ